MSSEELASPSDVNVVSVVETGRAEPEDAFYEDGDDASVASEEYEADLAEKLGFLEELCGQDIPIEQRVAWWYSWAPVHVADLGEELGGNESCFVSGEALILRLAEAESLSSSFSESLQFLPLFFKVERFLSHLAECGILLYNIVFFDCLQPVLLRQHPGLWAARELLILHLSCNPEKFQVKIFPSWFCSDYDSFIKSAQPFTFLMDDGGGLTAPNSLFAQDHCSSEDSDEDEDSGDDDSESKKKATDYCKGFFGLYSMILGTLCQGVSVALMYNFQRKGRKLECFTLFPSRASSEFFEAFRSSIVDVVTSQREESLELLEGLIETSPVNSEQLLATQTLCTSFQVSFRDSVIVKYATGDLKISDEEETPDAQSRGWSFVMVKLLLLSSLFADKLSLSQRYFPCLASKEQDPDNEFWNNLDGTLQFLMGNISSLLSQLVKESPDALNKLVLKNVLNCRTLVDFFDGRLLTMILVSCISFTRDNNKELTSEVFELSAEEVQRLDTLWSLIGVPEGGSFFPMDIRSFLNDPEHFLTQAPEQLWQTPDAATKPKLMHINQCDYLTKFLTPGGVTKGGQMPGTILDNETPEPATLRPPTDSVYPVPLPFDYMTHNLDTTEQKRAGPDWLRKLTGPEREKAEKRWELKQVQRKQLFLRNLAKHFGGVDVLHHPIVLATGKASSDHPWVREPVITSAQVSEADSSPVAKETDKKEKTAKKEKNAPKMSKKAAEIIAKNKENKALKVQKRDEEVSSLLNEGVKQVFSRKRLESPDKFNAGLLDLLLGPSRASETIDDFNGVKAYLQGGVTQLSVIVEVCEKSTTTLLNTFTKSADGKMSYISGMLQTIRILFRVVQTAFTKYRSYIDGPSVEVFQRLLIVMGFKNCAAALFQEWLKAQAVDEGEEIVVKNDKKGKGSKKGAADSKANAADLKFEVKNVKKLHDFAVTEGNENRFQMLHLSPDFERTLRSMQDPRVLFHPDGWQKDLLDIVDNRESALVVAPTSSGKTFICYYVMDKVLRFDNESVVVFVSPTRALALQVEAEVNARFGRKTYPTTSKTTLVGHLFEGRAEKPLNCQVLITLPNMFEGLLTSPTNQTWLQKVKYVVLDEIHCIGEDKLGQALENLIQLLPCPFMALSATVANDDIFCKWLKKAQCLDPPKPVRFILHTERYADLETKYYSSMARGLYVLNPFVCLDYSKVKSVGLPSDFSLTAPNVLELYDLITARMKLKENLSESQKVVIEDFESVLNPESFFAGKRAISKYDSGQYTVNLKQKLVKAVNEGVFNELDFNSVRDALLCRQPIALHSTPVWYGTTTGVKSLGEHAGATKSLAKKTETKIASTPSSIAPNEDLTLLSALRSAETESASGNAAVSLPEAFFTLVKNLSERDLLPALVFHFNRSTASRLFYRLAKKLIDGQHDKFYGTEEAAARTRALNKKRMDDWKVLKEHKEMAEKWKTLSKEEREEQGITEQYMAELAAPLPPEPIDIAEEFDSDYYLVDSKAYHAQKQAYDEVMATTRIHDKVSPLMLMCLRRGLGLYHDALHREYRRAVEYLFRMRYLRVVISDAALALGINMPCKSSVFAGDHHLLTPLMFRQTSGRAGRRGFDSLGHIVLWDFPEKKVRRLLCSPLPMLSGKYPVHPTMVCRSLCLSSNIAGQIVASHLEHDTKRSGITIDAIRQVDAAVVKFQKVFTSPLFEVGAPERIKNHLLTNIMYHLRFGADFLRRIGAINSIGAAGPFNSIAVGLCESSPANLLLNYLLCTRPFDPNDDEQSEDRSNMPMDGHQDELMHLISLVFRRREFTHSIVRRLEMLKELGPKANKIVCTPALKMHNQEFHPVLPPLPNSLANLVQDFDHLALQSAVDSTRAASTTISVSESEWKLPLSGVSFISSPSDNNNHPIPKLFNSACSDSDSKLRISHLSPFAAITQTAVKPLKSVDDIIFSVRDPLYIEKDMVPSVASGALASLPSRPEIKVPLVNSYACDVAKQSGLSYIIRDNGIPASEAYFLIEAFYRMLRTSVGAMDAVGPACERGIAPADSISSVHTAAPILAAKFDALYKDVRRRV